MSARRTRAGAAAAAGSPAARIAVACLAAGVALAALAVAVARPGAGSRTGPLEDPITVKQALSTTTALFGDPVQAEVDVYTNDRQVPSGSVRVRTAFAPFTTVSASVERASIGGVSLLRTRVTLQCMKRACLAPRQGGRVIRLPPIAVDYRRGGRDASTVVPWRALHLSSRLPQGASADIGVIDAAPPLSGRFGRSPKTLRFLLLLATAVLGVGGALLVASAVWPRSLAAERRWARLSPLERSLLQVEAAVRSDDESERRRTLDQLAIQLGEVRSPDLELETRALAWGQSPPEPEALALLARQVRTALNGGVGR